MRRTATCLHVGWRRVRSPVGRSWEEKPRGWAAARLLLRGAGQRRILDRASGLAFDAAFAAVPVLVLLVDLLRSFGLYTALRTELVEPLVLEELVRHGTGLGEAFATLLDTVEQADLRALGLTGSPILVYGGYMLLAATEGALNDVFGATRDRKFGHRMRDYALIVLSVALATCAAGALAYLLSDAGLRVGMRGLLIFAAWTTGLVALAAVYRFVPNTFVPWKAALIAAAVASVLGFGAFVVELELIGAARYRALYAGLAALPLFLLWLFTSWLAVLMGAEVAALVADWRGYAFRLRRREPGPVELTRIAARAVDALARAEEAGDQPTVRDLAQLLEEPEPLVDNALDPLRRAGIIENRGGEAATIAVLRRGALGTYVSEVLGALGRIDIQTGRMQRTSLIEVTLPRAPKGSLPEWFDERAGAFDEEE